MSSDLSERYGSLREAFLASDTNRSGRIGLYELRSMCERFNLPAQHAEHVLRMCDVDGDGQLNFGEFHSKFWGMAAAPGGHEGQRANFENPRYTQSLPQEQRVDGQQQWQHESWWRQQ